MLHRDKVVLEKILEVIKETDEILVDTLLENFLKNNKLKLAMTIEILRIGELVKNLSSEFRIENNHVKWKAIAGFRDVIAHRYDTLDIKEVYKTVKYELPELKSQIEKILEADK